MSAGSIVIDLLMKTGAFETDTARAESIAKKRAAAIDDAFAKMGRQIAISGAAAGAAIAAMVVQTTNTAGEIINLARVSGASTDEFQRMAAAAKSVGVEQDQLGDIFKDFREKIGEFVATGGGEMKDFFEQIAPKVGITADAFRNLSGPQALQLYFSSLEKAGLSTEQMSFYLESAANDATKLIPLMRDNGKEMSALGDAASEAGRIMSGETLAASQELSKQMGALQGMLSSASTEIASQLMPALSTLAKEFTTTGKNGSAVEKVADGLATTFEIAAATGMGVAFTIEALGKNIGGLAAMAAEVADGNLDGAKSIFRMMREDTADMMSRYGLAIDNVLNARKRLAGSNASTGPDTRPEPSDDPWKRANVESKDKKKGDKKDTRTDAEKEFEAALKSAQAMMRSARAEAEELTQAQAALADAMASKEWANYTATMQEQIRSAYQDADVTQQRTKAANELKAARESEQQTALDALDDLNRQIEALQIEIAYKKDAATVISVLSIARLKEKAAILEGFDGSEAAIELINREIQAREKLLGLTIQKDEKGDYWTEWLKAAEENMASFDELAGEVSKNFSAQFGSAFEQMIFESQSLGDAITGLTEGMARAVVNALGQMAAQWVATELIKRLASEATTTAVVAGTAAQAAAGVAANEAAVASAAVTGPAIAAEMAPAAVATSVATAGTNTLLAVAGIVAAMALIPKLAGARANGGPVASGQTYLVGERGPELFTPNTSGAIIPNHALGGPAQGGGVTVNLIEDKSRAGQTQERNNNGAREIDVFVSDIMGDGPRSKAMAKAFGLQRRGY